MRRFVAGVLAILALGTGSAFAQRGSTFSEEDVELAFSFSNAGDRWALRLFPAGSLEAAVASTKHGLLDLLTMPGGQAAALKPVAGQVSAGSIEGTIIRANNTPVAGAEVTAVDLHDVRGREQAAMQATAVVTRVGAQTASPRATWAPLPPNFAGDFTMDMATMKKLAGDAIALPIAGQFKTLAITAVDEDGTVTVKDLVVDTRLSGQPFKVTIHALHSHVTGTGRGRYAMQGQGAEGPQVPFVWHSFHVQSSTGIRLHLVGVYHDGALLGYSYERGALEGLPGGTAVPVFGRTGWQVVTVLGPATGDTIKIEGGTLRLFEAPGGRVGLARQ